MRFKRLNLAVILSCSFTLQGVQAGVFTIIDDAVKAAKAAKATSTGAAAADVAADAARATSKTSTEIEIYVAAQSGKMLKACESKDTKNSDQQATCQAKRQAFEKCLKAETVKSGETTSNVEICKKLSNF